MKRTSLTLAVILASTIATAQAADLNTDAKKVGYTLGSDIGKTLLEMNDDVSKSNVDYDSVLAGIKDAYDKKELALSDDEMSEVMKKFAKARQEEMKAKAEKMIAESKEKSQKFLEDNAKKDGIKVTKSGLQYKVIKEGTGATPNSNDDVAVQYEGRLIDGTVFDSSKSHGDKPVEFNIQQVIPGWVEGLQLMKEGGQYTFYIPADLAYGEMGQPQAGILPESALVFDITLEKVKPAKKDEKSTTEKATDAVKDAAANVAEKAKEAASATTDAVKDAAKSTTDAVKEAVSK